MGAEDFFLSFRAICLFVEGDFVEPEFQGLPVDQSDDLERKERVFEGVTDQAERGEVAGGPTDGGSEGDFVFSEVIDGDSELLPGEAKAEVEGVARIRKGGDVEVFRDFLFPNLSAVLIDEIEFHFAIGVDHFSDGKEGRAIGLVEIEK